MMKRKPVVVTMNRLNRALAAVQNELVQFEIFSDKIAKVDVYLTWFGTAYGYQYYRSTGQIEIPAISMSRLQEKFLGAERVCLRDILRHEYGHAAADCYRGLIRSKRFNSAFELPYSSDQSFEFSSSKHVTYYAATSASEDFAEVFMYFLKHRGKVPKRFDTLLIRKKWDFIRCLCHQIASGNNRWVQS